MDCGRKITERIAADWAPSLPPGAIDGRSVGCCETYGASLEHDHVKLKAWAKRYALPDSDGSWALVWARETIRLSRASVLVFSR